MDAFSTGASAIAFITIGIQSAKVVFDVLTAVHDLPEHVQGLRHDVEQLRCTLDRISRYQALAAEDDGWFETISRRCSEDIALYARRLENLQVSTWKKLRAAFSEKDIENMRRTVDRHITSLGVYLSMIQFDLMLDSRRSLEHLAPKRQITYFPAARHGGLGILNGLSDLARLWRKRDYMLGRDDIPHIAGCLEALLRAALDTSHVQARSGGRYQRSNELIHAHPSRSQNDMGLEIELISSLIASARQISINKLGRNTTARQQGTIVQQQRKRKRIALADGLLVVASLKRTRVGTNTPPPSCCTHFEVAGQEFMGTMTFFPVNPLSSVMIIASAHQEEVQGGTFSEIPRLVVNSLLPSDSLVFKVVQRGNVEELRALISEGQATLRDRDMNGMSLLHYAVCQPDMCRFLIAEGADVDEIAGKHDQAESLPLLSATTRAANSDRDSAEFKSAKECIEILLKAGADPTIALKSRDSPFHLTCNPKDLDLLEIFLELGSAFAHIELEDSRGQTPLLRICSWYSSYTRDAFEYLISRGANVNARDVTGATCLHLAIENARRPLSAEFNALAYLLSRGADPHAVTNDGESVSEIAYTTRSTDIVYKLGSYRGDLWDAVLAETGYDVASFRKGWRRKERFTSKYARKEFEQLWSKNEHLCPYFVPQSLVMPGQADPATATLDDETSVTVHEDCPDAGDVGDLPATRRGSDSVIRQRTDISVTVESLERVALSGKGDDKSYDRYEGVCVVGTQTPQVPLLCDPSLAHHLMPNPWHDIISPVDDEGSRYGGERSQPCPGTPESSSKPEYTKTYEPTRREPVWDRIEMENVWS